MKDQTTFNKVVNFDGQEILVLDYVFKHSDDFKGATGTRFEAISKSQYKEDTSKSSVIQCIEDCYTDEDLFNRYPNKRSVSDCLEQFYKDIKNAGEIETFTYDDSYRELWPYLREELNLDENEAYIFTCTGGGRCFDKDFQGNINPELSAIIREYEA